MSEPITCPQCNKPLAKRRVIGEVMPGWYWCAGCRRDWKDDYLVAFNKSTDLQAVMFSMTYVAIKPRRGTSDGWIIQTLFDKKDRRYVWLRGWVVTNLEKYSHIKCIQVATEAFLKQYALPEVI